MLGKRNMTVFAVLLILALATVGTGYGLWAKTLSIEGTVHTGEVNAVLSVEEVDQNASFDDLCPGDPVGDYTIGQNCDNVGGLNDDMEAEGKDVANCTAVPVDSGEYPDLINDGAQGMLVTISNAYPSFNCFVKFNVQNTGSIPVHVDTPKAYAWNGFWQPLGGGVEFGGNFGQSGLEYIFHLNSYPPTYSGATCYANNTQLEPTEGEDTTFCNLHFHLGQLAQMDSTYYFLVEVFVHQWNEAAGS